MAVSDSGFELLLPMEPLSMRQLSSTLRVQCLGATSRFGLTGRLTLPDCTGSATDSGFKVCHYGSSAGDSHCSQCQALPVMGRHGATA